MSWSISNLQTTHRKVRQKLKTRNNIALVHYIEKSRANSEIEFHWWLTFTTAYLNYFLLYVNHNPCFRH
jgi:hypothetical protein